MVGSVLMVVCGLVLAIWDFYFASSGFFSSAFFSPSAFFP
jgi:hypothetical protein